MGQGAQESAGEVNDGCIQEDPAVPLFVSVCIDMRTQGSEAKPSLGSAARRRRTAASLSLSFRASLLRQCVHMVEPTAQLCLARRCPARFHLPSLNLLHRPPCWSHPVLGSTAPTDQNDRLPAPAVRTNQALLHVPAQLDAPTPALTRRPSSLVNSQGTNLLRRNDKSSLGAINSAITSQECQPWTRFRGWHPATGRTLATPGRLSEPTGQPASP